MIVSALIIAIAIYAWITIAPYTFAVVTHALFFKDIPFDSDEADEKIGGIIYYLHILLHLVITVLAFYAGIEYAKTPGAVY